MIRSFKLKRTFNVPLVFKVVLAIALLYQVVPTIFDHMFSREYTSFFNQKPTNKEIVSEYYNKRKSWLTSNLGAVLFKSEPMKNHQQNRTFVVLVWKYWDWLKTRHLTGHSNLITERLENTVCDRNVTGSGSKPDCDYYQIKGIGPLNVARDSNGDPLDKCSVKNCIFTGDDKKIDSVDAVLVHIQRGIFPKVKTRNTTQRWVFLSDESPHNTFSMSNPKPKLSEIANVFNWSMTYRSDADVPVPYGRTVPLPNTSMKSIDQLIPFWNKKQKNVLVTVLISHCTVTERMEYIHELQKHVKVDVFGKCSTGKTKSCPGYFKADCPKINSYLFYLAFENSRCRQYLTEKIYYNAYTKGAIPIVMGPPVSDCAKLLPPNSFLHVDYFASPRELAMAILNISRSSQSLQMFHEWRRDFKIVNEHGYFRTKSYHLCRLCEALNYNDKETKIYDKDNLTLYLETKLLCSKNLT